MYAVIKTGGKQYKVEEGDTIRVEKLAGEKGDTITFNEILMIGGDEYVVGSPLIEDAQVSATVVRQFKDKKVIVFKMKRRKRYHRKQGHRQELTEVRITSIAKGKEA